MIRGAVIVVCTLMALGTGGLMLGTSFRPVSWTGPENVGPAACGLAVCGGGLLASYWRFVDNPPPADRRVHIGLILYYETEVHHGATGYSGRYREPCPHGLTVSATSGTLVTTVLSLTLWLPLFVFSVYPIAVFIRGPFRRWRRAQKGRCIRCGYDLTGNVTGVCPECGMQL